MSAIALSENPFFFKFNNHSLSRSSILLSFNLCSSSTIHLNFSMKNVSIPVILAILSILYSLLSISAKAKILSSSGQTTLSFNSAMLNSLNFLCSNEYFPISRLLIPFNNACSRFAPIAITSPVAIIFVPSSLSAPKNLSNGHFGILHTT